MIPLREAHFVISVREHLFVISLREAHFASSAKLCRCSVDVKGSALRPFRCICVAFATRMRFRYLGKSEEISLAGPSVEEIHPRTSPCEEQDYRQEPNWRTYQLMKVDFPEEWFPIMRMLIFRSGTTGSGAPSSCEIVTRPAK